jgi:Domain of Unknown Function (DUF748)
LKGDAMRRVPRPLLAAAALVVLLVAARLALGPLVAWRTREVLGHLEGMRGTFSGVDVRVSDLSYAIHDLRIDAQERGGAAQPFFHAARARFSLSWREVLRGRFVAGVELDAPRLTVVQRGKPRRDKGGGDRIEEVPAAARRLAELTPFRVDRAQVRDGTLVFVDARAKGRPRVSIQAIEATLENFATRRSVSRREPSVLAAKGTLQKSGRISVFATADPLAKRVTFAGEAKLRGLRAAELRDLFAARTHIEPTGGLLDMDVSFKAVDGRITGGVRPVLTGVGTRPADPGLRAQLESAFSDSALQLFADDGGKRDPAETTIPISGVVQDPRAHPFPVVIGLLRNAFVRGLSDAFAGRPPPGAKEPGGAREQARRGAATRRAQQPRAEARGR